MGQKVKTESGIVHKWGRTPGGREFVASKHPSGHTRVEIVADKGHLDPERPGFARRGHVLRREPDGKAATKSRYKETNGPGGKYSERTIKKSFTKPEKKK